MKKPVSEYKDAKYDKNTEKVGVDIKKATTMGVIAPIEKPEILLEEDIKKSNHEKTKKESSFPRPRLAGRIVPNAKIPKKPKK